MGRRKRKLSDGVVVVSTQSKRRTPPGNQVISVCCNPLEKVQRRTTFIPPPSASTAATTSPNASEDINDGLESVPKDEIDIAHLNEAFAGNGGDARDTNDAQTHHASALTDWADHYRQHYLEEFMRHDGRAGRENCADCPGEGVYKCKDCFGCQLYCKPCFVERHSQNPFHRALFWTGTYFDDISLKSLGVSVHLGHGGQRCSIPGDHIQDFTIIDTNGIHEVDLQFCGCYQTPGGSRRRTQLLRAGLLPSTHIRPTTAFTFNVLDFFHLLTLQGKINAYDFYLSLQRLSDNTGGRRIKNRYDQFMQAMRIWRHLKLVKRAGRAYDPLGVAITQQGECAVECPACPHPDRNLPVGWERSPPSKQWLYRLILTVDANFRLKCKDRGNKTDISLGDGWAYWVPQPEYKEYLRKHSHQIEPNLCGSQLRAVDHANLKFSGGYVATGVGGVICARHCLVRKGGLGDLQKGERYANMDFLVFTSLAGTPSVRSLLLSYDIACQWSRNLKQRITQLPIGIQPSHELIENTTFAIPKAHINGHGEDCQENLSLNLLRYSARTDGEEPERWWAHMNPLSMSTREMGLGSRHDTIDDHAAAWNWRKTTDLGVYLLARMREALRMRSKTKAALGHFSARFSHETISEWTAMIEAWDDDNKSPNPYANKQNKTTISDVRLTLAEEDLQSIASGSLPPHQMTPGRFLQMGLDIEEQQRVLRHCTSTKIPQQVTLQEKRAMLLRRIQLWRDVQAYYMPEVAGLTASEDNDHHPELITLNMPSTIPVHLIPPKALADKERRLRHAQAVDALVELRKLLRVRFGLQDFKYTQVGYAQKANTRMRTVLTRFQEKISRTAERYQAARSALLHLEPDGLWIKHLLVLMPEHIKGPGREEDDESEGRRELSWIWTVKIGSDDKCEEDVDSALQVEWARAFARACRWEEEVMLLVEEMRRVLWFFWWKRMSWLERAKQCQDVRADLREGLAGYAAKQVAILDGLGAQFADDWYLVLMTHGLDTDWPEKYVKRWRGVKMDTEYGGEDRNVGEEISEDEDLDFE